MNKTLIAATLQKLIDEAANLVCADYDEGGSIKTRVLALNNGGERKTIELIFSGILVEGGTLLDEADKVIGAMDAQGSAKIVPLWGEELDVVLILAACSGWNAQCWLIVHRKTGKSDTDISLVTEFADDSDVKFPHSIPSKWTGPVGKASSYVVPE